MKTLKNSLKKTLLLFLLSSSYLHISFAQDAAAKSPDVKKLIDSKRLVFEVQSTLPMRGTARQESYGYSLKVSGDTLTCYLPYYGRATMPTMNPGDRPLDFISTNFEYSVKEKKNGGREIHVVPKDQKDVREMSLTIFDNGNASLYVGSDNLDPISYTGFITAIKSK